MACGNVSNLVRHHTGQLRFRFGLQNQPGVHIEETARKSHGVYVFAVQNLNGDRNLDVGIADQILANAVHVFRNDWIIDDASLPFQFLGNLFTKGDFFFEGIEVDTLIDVAIANGVGIFLLIFLGQNGRRHQRNEHCQQA